MGVLDHEDEGLNIELTRDWNKLRGILMHPEIQDRAMEDKNSPGWFSEEEIAAGMQDPVATPLLVSGGGTPVAVYVLVAKAPGVYEGHAHVLPEHRAEYAVSATRAAIQWAWNHLNMRRLEAVIPTKFPDVFKHCLKVGFVLRDIIEQVPNSYRQDGRTYALYYMVMHKNASSSSRSNRRRVGSQ